MNTYDHAESMLTKKGYLDLSVPKEVDVLSEIKRMQKEKNALILAHFYQRGDIQDVADFLGDSLQLARVAQSTDADCIVFCGVHFMAETAKILNPEKKVLLPDLNAGCSLADSCTGAALAQLKQKHPEAIVVSYINCSSEVKAESDIIVTSSNAAHIVRSLPAGQEIIFAPDKNLGSYISKITGRDMILWDGACMVHQAFSLERISRQLASNPAAKLIAHPEADAPLLNVANYIGSTSNLLDYVVKDSSMEYIVATEEGILHQMQKRVPHKRLIPALVKDETCSCSECHFMKLNTMEKLYLCLKHELPEILIDEQLRQKALLPIERMLQMSESIK